MSSTCHSPHPDLMSLLLGGRYYWEGALLGGGSSDAIQENDILELWMRWSESNCLMARAVCHAVHRHALSSLNIVNITAQNNEMTSRLAGLLVVALFTLSRADLIISAPPTSKVGAEKCVRVYVRPLNSALQIAGDNQRCIRRESALHRSGDRNPTNFFASIVDRHSLLRGRLPRSAHHRQVPYNTPACLTTHIFMWM